MSFLTNFGGVFLISGVPAEHQLVRYKGLYRGLANRVYRLSLDEYMKDSDSERSLEPLHPKIKRDDKSPNGILSVVRKEER